MSKTAALLTLALLSPSLALAQSSQAQQSNVPVSSAGTAPAEEIQDVRVEPLTANELVQLGDAQKAVAAAEKRLNEAKNDLLGTKQGIEQNHHANTDCGCYASAQGREYDVVEYVGKYLIIRHVSEQPLWSSDFVVDSATTEQAAPYNGGHPQ